MNVFLANKDELPEGGPGRLTNANARSADSDKESKTEELRVT